MRTLAAVVFVVLPGLSAGCARQNVGAAQTSISATAKPATDAGIPAGWQAVDPHTQKAAGYRIVHPPTGIEMVWVPGGTFTMGVSHNDAPVLAKRYDVRYLFEPARSNPFPDAQPAHRVRLDGFWLGRTEVTIGQWRKVMGPPSPKAEWAEWADDNPPSDISWYEARSFCEKLGLRLPTEAEWEYAARGQDGRMFPWGNDWVGDECRHWIMDSGPAGYVVGPVGSHPKDVSWCGALDLAGNVSEWCADWYDETYYHRSPAENPTGPKEGHYRAFRGGYRLLNGPGGFLSFERWRGEPAVHATGHGLRVAF